MNISIILPCFNENKNLEKIINSIIFIKEKYSTINLNFILVENGSTDNSKITLDYFYQKYQNKFSVLFLEKNLGYGGGIMSGVLNSKTEIICWTHADLQFDLNDIVELVITNYENLINNNVIIKGKRKGRIFIDKFFTNMMSYTASLFYLKKYVSDINAQPKIFHKKLVSKLIDYPNDFLLDLFLIKRALDNNYQIEENEIIMNKRLYGEAKGGGSFLGKIKLSLRTLKFIFKN
jgi:glycosyltransferase involved in cell wall biosynthesis